MASQAPSVIAKRLEAQVRNILRTIELPKLGIDLRNMLVDLRQGLERARVRAQEYELSETREEQISAAKAAKRELTQARRKILKASEQNIFTAINVAHLTAQIDQIEGGLK